MNMVCIELCLAIFVLGLYRGKLWSNLRSLEGYAGLALFWVSVIGVVAMLFSLGSIIGIAASFDERTDSWNKYDDMLLIGKTISYLCAGIALVLHGMQIVAERASLKHVTIR
jgi:hypothetical protein